MVFTAMPAHHRLGRTGARARGVSRRIHAQRLLAALLSVCTQLHRVLEGEAAAACLDVRARLADLLTRPSFIPARRRRKKGELQ